jgi:hypothetical protein
MNKSINDQINENLALIIKKANIFEKITELKNSTRGFIFFSGFATTFFVITSFYNSYLCFKLLNKVRMIELSNNSLFQSFKHIEFVLDKKINNLNKKIDLLIESNNSLIEMNKSYIKQNICVDETINHKKIISNTEDDELLNECYDNIPCNNIKKATGLNSLFGF